MDNTKYTTVTIKVKKHFDEKGKPTCFGCRFHYESMLIGRSSKWGMCAALDEEIGACSDLYTSSSPLKNCPVHFSKSK